MPRIITFATFSASLILVCLLLVGGCEKKQEINPDIIPYGELTEAIVFYPQPCPPETVYVMPPGTWMSVKVSDLWSRYCVDPHIGKGIDDNVYLIILPDSVGIDSAFIPSNILSEAEGKGE